MILGIVQHNGRNAIENENQFLLKLDDFFNFIENLLLSH
jgi:hypothetical protein